MASSDSLVQADVAMVARSPKSFGFSLENLPRHHYHLGGSKFLVISDFGGKITIHLRSYMWDGAAFHPTKHGITFSGATFVDLIDSVFELCVGGKIHIINNELFISSSYHGDVHRFQKLFTDRDNCFHLTPVGVSLNDDQLSSLRSVIGPAWNSVQDLMFGPMFKIAVRVPSGFGSVLTDEVDLAMILMDMVKELLVTQVQEMFQCPECQLPPDEMPNNQLAHTCVTTDLAGKIAMTFNKALASLTPVSIAKKLQECCQSDIPRSFAENISGVDVFQGVKAMCESEYE